MKRKMLFMAALAGVVTLASCVKDDESGSVTAVRNAKAAQLNGEATVSAAQAKFLEAQAALQNAQAATEQAQARIQAVQASIDEATQASQIARIIAQNNSTAATSNQNWQSAINQLKQLERQELDQLIQRYDNAVTDYRNAIDGVLNVQAAIKTAQLDKEHYVKSLENLNKNFKQNLAAKQAELAALKEMETTGMTQAEIDAAVAIKTSERDNAIAEFDQSAEVQALMSASEALDAAEETYSTLIDAWNEVNAITSNDWGLMVIDQASTKDIVADTDFGDFAVFEYYTYTGNPVDRYIDDGWDGLHWTQSVKTSRINEANKLIIDRNYDNVIEVTKDALDDATDLLGTTADTKDTKTKREANQDGGGNQLPTLYADLATANAMPETTDAEKAAKKAAVEAAEDAIATQLDNINDGLLGFQTLYDDAVADKEKYEEALLLADTDAMKEGASDFEEALVNFNEAMLDVEVISEDITKLTNEINALNAITPQDIDGQIKQVEQDIANLEDAIANNERLIYGPYAPLTYDEAIAHLELELAKQQAEVEVQAAKLAIAKEELEEAIGDFDPEEIDDEPAADADADTEG